MVDLHCQILVNWIPVPAITICLEGGFFEPLDLLVLSLLFASGYREKLSVILKAKLHWLAVFCYAGRCYVLVRSKLFLLLRGWQICFFKSISWNRLSSKGCVPSSDCVGQARGGMAKEVPVEYRRICFFKKRVS